MKKVIVLAAAACLLMTSVAFAFETKSSTDNGSYIEQMAKKKTKKSKKPAQPAS